jgi:hydroxyacylglutathione hydrolase
MLLKYFYNSKLAHASYMVGCQRAAEAIIVDPGRDIEPYLAEAKAQGLRLAAVTETHIHADFLSGARELAERAGAKLYLSAEGGPDWAYQYLADYPHQLLKDGAAFKIGNIKFEVMHTPGHTPEHISLLVTDTAGANKPMGIFSGDFVFVGDVGRPDLLEKAAGEAGSAEVGARHMFQSLQRFKTLPDYMQLWPAHGAGSACGKALGAVPSSTVGYEKMFNAALGYTDVASFTRALLDGQPEPPKYFAMMKRLNKQGPQVLGQPIIPAQLSLDQLKAFLAQSATIVDTRPASAFSRAHLPGTINIPYNDDFINWSGWLLDYNQQFYLIAYSGQLSQIIQDLSYIGLDNAAGYVEPNVIETWSRSGEKLQSYPVVTAQEIGSKVKQGEVTMIDVRGLSEWQESHISEARHIMLGYLSERLAEVPTGKPVVMQCQSGVRSAIAASILQAGGVTNVMNLKGGIGAWAAAGLPLSRGAR